MIHNNKNNNNSGENPLTAWLQWEVYIQAHSDGPTEFRTRVNTFIPLENDIKKLSLKIYLYSYFLEFQKSLTVVIFLRLE